MTKTARDTSKSWSDSQGTKILEMSIDSRNEIDKCLDLLGADGVIVDVRVYAEDAVTFGIYHRGGSLLEETLTGPVSRTFELDVERQNSTSQLLFIKTWRTTADIEITLKP